MSRIAGINLNTNSTMPGIPDVLCIFPKVEPSCFVVPMPRKKPSKTKLHKTNGNARQLICDAQGAQGQAVQDLAVDLPKLGGSLAFARVYDSQDMDSGAFGRSWFHAFESRITTYTAASAYFTNSASETGPMVVTGESLDPEGKLQRVVSELGVKGDGSVELGEAPVKLIAELRAPDGRRLIYTRTDSGGLFCGSSSSLHIIAGRQEGY